MPWLDLGIIQTQSPADITEVVLSLSEDESRNAIHERPFDAIDLKPRPRSYVVGPVRMGF